MKFKSRNVLIFALFILIGGCGSNEEFVENNIPKKEDGFAKHYIHLLKKEKYDSAYYLLASSIKNQNSLNGLKQISPYLQNVDSGITIISFYKSSKTLLFSTSKNDSQSVTNTEIDYKTDLKKGWLHINLVVENINNNLRISGIHVEPISQPIEELTAFTFKNAGFVDYLFLIIAVFIPVFIIYSIIQLFRTEISKKWLRFIFILFGICKFNLYWATSKITLALFSFQILGAGYYKPGILSPYIISISIPLGAIIFYGKRRKLFQYKLREKELFNNNEILPSEIDCPNCGTFLELEEEERNNKSFMCPKCKQIFKAENHTELQKS